MNVLMLPSAPVVREMEAKQGEASSATFVSEPKWRDPSQRVSWYRKKREQTGAEEETPTSIKYANEDIKSSKLK